jgi:small subunit ribosomal protein S4e
LIISGENAGTVGKIGEVREGTFILPKRVVLALENRKVELPVDMIMVVGTDKPLITIR